MPDPQLNRDLITEILEMTVSIERVVFKADGFPKAKLFQSAKAAVPRGVAPEAISATLQAFILTEMDKLEAGPRAPPQGQGKAQDPKPTLPPSSSPPRPTEIKPAQPAAEKTSAKFSEAQPAAPASNPPDPQRAKEVREKRIRGAYARRKHKRGGEQCVRVCLEKWGKEHIEDLEDQALKVLLDALDKLPENGEAHGGGGAWR